MARLTESFFYPNSARSTPFVGGSYLFVDVHFGLKPPDGKEANWVQTSPGKGWIVILRLYGPLQPGFDLGIRVRVGVE